MYEPRPKQLEILAYRSGRMGVSAVPGSGKTQTLSYLAAELVASGMLADGQEVLVVTLVNSAVNNFAHRVASFIQSRGLVAGIGYRVRTLHGLAHDIVRERPGLVGLSDGFQIIDERAAEGILQGASDTWLRGHPEALDAVLVPELGERELRRVRDRDWPDLVRSMATSLIRQAKDLRLTPADLRRALEPSPEAFPLMEMGSAIYADYQRALASRGAVDFDDLIALALTALESDPEYLERLRNRWPFILEDEAQDSSRLQEEILRLLEGREGNWVRVGDPNQAIYETFTTANPQFLRDFLDEPDVLRREMPNSGRSTRSILRLANYLIDWTQFEHPTVSLRGALTPPHIEPTPPGDPQPNPEDDPRGVQLVDLAYTPAEELKAVVTSIEGWLPDNLEKTVAVLVPRNQRGFEVVGALKARGIPYVELLQSTRATRETAGALTHLLKHLAEPEASKYLESAFRVWRREDREDEEAWGRVKRGAALLKKVRRAEDFLWPRLDRDWLSEQGLEETDLELHHLLQAFRDITQRWHAASLLPIDQLIMTLAQDLFADPVDLALSQKLASLLGRTSAANPSWRLPEFSRELEVVAKNERRFLGLSDDDTGFDPEAHRGEVVVATVHKAKGLEWDRVYLMSVNNYDFPSDMPHDSYIAERWFVREALNLEAESMAQFEAAVLGRPYVEGYATKRARLDYAAERLRLLYVGITRAKTEMIVTWNTGRNGERQQSVPFIALKVFWEGVLADTSGQDARIAGEG